MKVADGMVSKCQEAQPSSPAEDETTKQLVQQEVDFRWPVELPRRVRVHRQLWSAVSNHQLSNQTHSKHGKDCLGTRNQTKIPRGRPVPQAALPRCVGMLEGHTDFCPET